MNTAEKWPVQDRGYALLIVLWFLMTISAVSIVMLTNARSETALANNVKSAAVAEALADVGVARAAFNEMNPVRGERWDTDGETHRIQVSGGAIDISITDEDQKINPNHASDALLASLFEAAGVDRTRAKRLGAAVADWVSPDGPPREFGAKLDQYRAAGRSYGPANAPFESLDDLQLVLGMTPEVFSAVRPYLTIFTDSSEPKAKTLPPIVRRALAIASHKDENEGDDTASPQSPLSAPSTAEGSDDAEKKPVIEVRSTAKSVSGGTFVRIAVLRLHTEDASGYAVLDWRRGQLDN